MDWIETNLVYRKLTVAADVSSRLPYCRSSLAVDTDLIVIHREIPQKHKKPVRAKSAGGPFKVRILLWLETITTAICGHAAHRVGGR